MRRKKKKAKDKIFLSFSKKQFAHGIYPVMAGIPTAILLLYAINIGDIYRDILNNLISPIVTGVVSGVVLYLFGLKK